MAEEAAESHAAASSSGGGGGGSNKLVMILGAVNLVLTLGIVGVLVVSFQRDRKAAQVADISAEEPHAEKAEGGHGGGEGHGGEGHGEGHGEGGGAKKGSLNFGKMIPLEQFTVNLSTPGTVNPKFVRVNIALEVPNADTESEITQKMPQVRNTIIDLFNSKRSSDLATAEGRDYLKEEIRNALNSFMVSGKVKGVFFLNFTVSS